MRQISKRDAYSYPSSNRIYRTPEAAAKGLAWKIISEKYEDVMSAGTINILSYSCECDEESQFPYNGCQLHDRQSGYFRRLSIRLQRIILKKYNGE